MPAVNYSIPGGYPVHLNSAKLHDFEGGRSSTALDLFDVNNLVNSLNGNRYSTIFNGKEELDSVRRKSELSDRIRSLPKSCRIPAGTYKGKNALLSYEVVTHKSEPFMQVTIQFGGVLKEWIPERSILPEKIKDFLGI